jgi:hypothetical protein
VVSDQWSVVSKIPGWRLRFVFEYERRSLLGCHGNIVRQTGIIIGKVGREIVER